MNIFLTSLMAFASGAFGVAIGAAASIIMCALVALVGLAANFAGADFNLVGEVAFGLLLGPQVSFAPTCCALGYAWKRGYIKNSRDIFTPLISLNHTDILAVGGLFGIAGWYLNVFLEQTAGVKIDCVAMSVTLLSIAGKWYFSGSPIGKMSNGQKRFEPGSPCWLPWQTAGTDWNLLALGIMVSLPSGGATLTLCAAATESGNPFLASQSDLLIWAIGLILLILLAAGHSVPVFRHIGLCASLAAKMSLEAGGSEAQAVLWGAATGLLATYAGDWLGKLFGANGEGYVDSPTAAIAAVAPFPLFLFPLMGADRPESPLFFVLLLAILAGIMLYDINYKRRCRAAKI